MKTCVVLIALAFSCQAADKPAEPRFESDILPVFQQSCLACHSAKAKQGGLSLETPDDILRGGKSGPAIVPGKPLESLLLTMVSSGKMPMGGAKLPEEPLALIRRWIESAKANVSVSEREVAAVLGANCLVCHGRRTKEAGLDLRTRASMLKGGRSGSAIVPGKPEESLLIKRVSTQQMPPPKLQEQFSVRGLSSDEFEKVRQWIAAGAPEDNERPLEVRTDADPKVSEKDRQFWSFKAPVRPTVPGKSRNPIDAFLLEKLQAKGLNFSKEAERLTLMRRVYFDLTGLPPTPAEIEAYIKDTQPDSYERLIDRLLASPHYGERWARYWMDAIGYADSEGGVSNDSPRFDAWRYRDYVIRSLNADKPYDQFLTEQIAGDELFDYKASPQLKPDQMDKLVATGFLRMGPDATYSTEQNFTTERMDVVAGELEVLSSAVMGLTVACARCHDHKYDPLPQRDYYRLSAILRTAYDPYDWLTPTTNCVGVGAKCGDSNARFLPLDDPQGRKQIEEQNAPVEAAVKELEKLLEDKAAPFRKQVSDEKAKLEDLEEKFEEFRKEALAIRTKIAKEKARLKPMPKIRALFDMGGEPTPTRILLRGEASSPGTLVAPGVPSVLSAGLPAFKVEKPAWSSDTSGRRLALARWLTQPNHPLTARVMVNRIWQGHFGTGLVRTPGNFGRTGAPPTHPELLDWLSTEFVQQGWSIKAMHRLIMTSTTYRQSSKADTARQTVDPENTLLSRFPLRRLDADALRDSILKVAGRLDETPFGTPDELEALPSGEITVKPSPKGYRRTIYLQQRRSKPISLLESFDVPQLNPNCLKRAQSTVSTQALHLMNGDLVRETSRYMAGRIMDAAGDDRRRQIERGYLATYCRRPSEAEITAAESTLEQLNLAFKRELETKLPAEPVAHKAQWLSLAALCHTLLNSAEFLYID